jgi:hypothetical protein
VSEGKAAASPGAAARPRRNRKSAKKAGTSFERAIADCLAEHVDDRIDRAVKRGAMDPGDIAGLRTVHGQKIAVECKDVNTMALPQWLREAAVERDNIAAIAGVVVHKRRGITDPLEQYVTMTMREFIALVKISREGLD